MGYSALYGMSVIGYIPSLVLAWLFRVHSGFIAPSPPGRASVNNTRGESFSIR